MPRGRQDTAPAPPEGDAGFLALPPLSEGPASTAPTMRMEGRSWISTWRSPGFMTGMSHLVDPSAPSGVVADLVKPGLPVQRSLDTELTLRPRPRQRPAAGSEAAPHVDLDGSGAPAAEAPPKSGLRAFVQRLFKRRSAPPSSPPAATPSQASEDISDLAAASSVHVPVSPVLLHSPQAPLPPVLRLPAVAAPAPSPDLVRASPLDLPPRRVAALLPSAYASGREVRSPELPLAPVQRAAVEVPTLSEPERSTEPPAPTPPLATATAPVRRRPGLGAPLTERALPPSVQRTSTTPPTSPVGDSPVAALRQQAELVLQRHRDEAAATETADEPRLLEPTSTDAQAPLVSATELPLQVVDAPNDSVNAPVRPSVQQPAVQRATEPVGSEPTVTAAQVVEHPAVRGTRRIPQLPVVQRVTEPATGAGDEAEPTHDQPATAATATTPVLAALPVVQPILADRPAVMPERTEASEPHTASEPPAVQLRAIDRSPGRLEQLRPSLQRTESTAPATHQSQPTATTPSAHTMPAVQLSSTMPALPAMHAAPAPTVVAKPIASSPARTTPSLVAPAHPVVVQRTANTPPSPEPDRDQRTAVDYPTAQRADAPADPPPAAPEASSTAPPPGTTPGSPGTPGTPGGTDIDGLARKLYDPIARRLRAELRVDRERAGTLVDRPW